MKGTNWKEGRKESGYGQLIKWHRAHSLHGMAWHGV